MKPRVSSLNPYAASYIPLSKREACDRTELTQGAQKLLIPEGSTVKSHLAHGSYCSSSKQMIDEEFEMDLEYLQMLFSGLSDLSDQSLADVYLANNRDLETTVDMLTQLEFDTFKSSENLPDTLDIGDVSESGFSSECAAMKLKTMVGQAAASSSGSPGSAIVS